VYSEVVFKRCQHLWQFNRREVESRGLTPRKGKGILWPHVSPDKEIVNLLKMASLSGEDQFFEEKAGVHQFCSRWQHMPPSTRAKWHQDRWRCHIKRGRLISPEGGPSGFVF